MSKQSEIRIGIAEIIASIKYPDLDSIEEVDLDTKKVLWRWEPKDAMLVWSDAILEYLHEQGVVIRKNS